LVELKLTEDLKVDSDMESKLQSKLKTLRRDLPNLPRLARKFHIDVDEVRRILAAFEARTSDTEEGFRPVLAAVFGFEEVPQALLDSAWAAFGRELAVDDFFVWYQANLFGQVQATTQSSSDALVYDIANECMILPTVVDKLKAKFDAFDSDGSGFIDYSEFTEMLKTLLRVRDKSDISDVRLERWWKEIDGDGSGEVDFREFCAWYTKYFNDPSDVASSSIDRGGLLGQFYSSYNPCSTRRCRASRRRKPCY